MRAFRATRRPAGAARIEWTLADQPDAMIVALGGNDLLRGVDPASSRANLDAILQATSAAGVPVLLAGLPAPGNYGPDFSRDFEGMYVDLAAEYDAILVSRLPRPHRREGHAGAVRWPT